ncbi:MAG TPA: DUF3501 family protein [candidate division Zixibacteria bacterium]|nr:DUF3501 family protein [candidate division Zixibacteria bacterium]
MKKITLDDIMGPEAYEKIREEFRRRIIELKRNRRVPVGDRVSLVFENRDTVLFQIQEMLRAERITDLDKIREEIDVYNDLIPGPGELSATLFLEIEDQTRLREELLKFLGIDEAVFLRIGDTVVRARFEEGRSKEDKISAVQYVKFPLGPREIAAFRDLESVELFIDHPQYKASARISGEAKKALCRDFED